MFHTIHVIAQAATDATSGGGGLQPSDYAIGGIAGAVIAFAGTVVKIVLGMLENEKKRSVDALAIERARGDRLETSAMQAIPALTSSNLQQQANQDLIKQMGQQMLEMARKAAGA